MLRVLAIDQTLQLEKRREAAFVLIINQNKTRLEIDMNYQSNQIKSKYNQDDWKLYYNTNFTEKRRERIIIIIIIIII